MERITEKQRKYISFLLNDLKLNDQKNELMQSCEGIINIYSLNQMSRQGAKEMISILLQKSAQKDREETIRRTDEMTTNALKEKRKKIVFALCYKRGLCVTGNKIIPYLLDDYCLNYGPHQKHFRYHTTEELQDLIDFLK